MLDWDMLNVGVERYNWLLPPHDLETMKTLIADGEFNSCRGLLPALGYCAFFGVARIFLTSFLFKPFGAWAMKLSFRNIQRNKEIDGELKNVKLRKITVENVKAIAKTTGVEINSVNKYIWELRRQESMRMRMTKFVEAIWRFVFYSIFCVLGIRALFFPTAEWVLNTENHWLNWPRQPIDSAVIVFYQVQLGSYLHQLMWTEISRSDAMEMILHHVITITVVVFSFLTGFNRIGASIFLVHDLADIWLEMGKCFVYISRAKGNEWAKVACDVFFVIFAVTFAVTRLYIYPKYLLYSLLYEAPQMLGMWSGYYAFAGLLLGLQGLHIFWFYLIARMVVRLATTGIEKDERSDDEDMEDEMISIQSDKTSADSTTSTPVARKRVANK